MEGLRSFHELSETRVKRLHDTPLEHALLMLDHKEQITFNVLAHITCTSILQVKASHMAKFNM